MLVASWSRPRRPRWGSRAVFIVAVVASAAILLGHLPLGRCQDDGNHDIKQFSNRASNKMRKIVSDRLTNLTSSFAKEAGKYVHFCVRDTDKEWNEAFNFSSDSTFLERCLEELGDDEDLKRRLCTIAEIKFYFSSFYSSDEEKSNIKPNNNCNQMSWVPGCEPGWSCSVKENFNVNLTEDTVVPDRNLNCRPCCEGFFSPQGLTCMIPCPLGAYCPVGKLNAVTGLCDPYNYQPPPGQPNHSCGTADMWADVGSSSEMFCPPGYYCPSTIRKISCSSGHYCRMGSTYPTRCFREESCPRNSETQDITIFGVLLMVALVLVLLIIYNFSGQILTNKERKQAKSREAAAKHVRETVQAREKWNKAKETAKNQARGLRSQLSRTFSRKKSVNEDSSDAASQSSDKMEESNLTKLMQSLEEDPDSNEGFNVEIGDKNLKKHMPKGKEMHTRSQIFEYAYGQIEKEKAMQQNKDLSFSGVISMASDNDIRTRLTIEVDFRDLTLILKGTKKKILRSVTGKLHPGHVAAVMGPSGAGKTTFLSALTGKTSGCLATGQVLINGKPDPIRSYKKIIGFVPQDDIVHGNLTVEENLWFSACCRLPADMSKADKVLVVERVIESLGLQAIRESLVGTVEKRGISGGQKKRVNVGLEMVMEPSLLILDEPTSGLDSSSSALLLQALKREALEGVNICMVLHQPSYTLFRMFDDLILLAKGGLTAYHGSVKTVEEYFSGLGINVPERVNPPDYFIDILEGIIKLDGVDYKELPLRWMLHNGYDVPRDMLQESGDIDTSNRGSEHSESNSSAESVRQSPAREVWDNSRDKVGQNQDEFEQHSSTHNDLSNRTTPGIFTQYKYFLGRVGKQRLREARIQGVDFLILCLAGVCLGILAKVSDETFGALGYTYTVIAVSLLCKIGALRSFQLERVHYWRERASGMSSLAYFLSRDTIDHFNTIIKPIVYLSMFYFFNNPRSSIYDNYIILVALVYCVTGIGYAFAIFFQPGSAQLWSVLLPVVLTLLSTQKHSSKIMKHLTDMCYTKWALEAFVIANAERYSGVWLVTRCGSLLKNDYDISEARMCLVVLVINGIVFRAIAFFCMVIFQKN